MPENESLKYYMGGTIKAVGDGKVEGYLVPFTDENNRDLDGEFFNAETDFMEDDYPIKGIPVLYHHGLDTKVSVKPIGKITEVKKDDLGIWVQAQLDMRDEYEKAIYELTTKGKLGWSSGALPQGVIVKANGHIARWPIIEGSETPTPAMPTKTQVHTAKSLSALIELNAEEANGVDDETDNETTETETTHKSMKETIMEMTDEQRALLVEILQDLLGESGMEASEKQEEEMLEEMEKQAGEVVEEELEEEEAKSISIEQLNALFNEHLKSLIPNAIKEHVEAKEFADKNRKAAAANAISAVKAGVEGGSMKKRRGGFRKNTENTTEQPKITVELERRFADANWQDMALFVKCKYAELGNLPEYMKKKVVLGDLVSPEFARAMAYKMQAGLQSEPIKDAVDAVAIKAQAPWMVKANELDATNLTNQGLEWVGTTFDADLWQRARHETELLDKLTAKGMRIKDVDPGTNKVTFAIDTGSGTVFTRGEANSVDATGRPEVTVQVQPFTTDNVTVTAKEHAIAYIPTNWLTEDTFVDTMQFIQFDMLQLLMESLESTLLNGDTATAANTNINLIDGTPATGLQTPDYIAWDGMRKNFLVTNTTRGRDASGSLAITDYIDTRALFGTTVRNRKNNMLTIIDFDTEVATRKLVQLLTADVAGGADRATMYTGALPQVLDGVDTYTSGLLGLANTAGKVSATAGNNTTGTIVVAYAPYIAYGRKRQVEVKQQEDILSGSMVFVASIRHTSVHRSADGSVGTYNVGV